jgi:hypothetical protein
MPTCTVPVYFTKEQIDNFGNLTGDNGPVHSIDGIVQGGFIISMLPQWLKQTKDGTEFSKSSKQAVSLLLDTKFRNKLPAHTPAKITFTYNEPGTTFSKISWAVHDDTIEYCSGKWIIYKS